MSAHEELLLTLVYGAYSQSDVENSAKELLHLCQNASSCSGLLPFSSSIFATITSLPDSIIQAKNIRELLGKALALLAAKLLKESKSSRENRVILLDSLRACTSSIEGPFNLNRALLVLATWNEFFKSTKRFKGDSEEELEILCLGIQAAKCAFQISSLEVVARSCKLMLRIKTIICYCDYKKMIDVSTEFFPLVERIILQSSQSRSKSVLKEVECFVVGLSEILRRYPCRTNALLKQLASDFLKSTMDREKQWIVMSATNILKSFSSNFDFEKDDSLGGLFDASINGSTLEIQYLDFLKYFFQIQEKVSAYSGPILKFLTYPSQDSNILNLKVQLLKELLENQRLELKFQDLHTVLIYHFEAKLYPVNQVFIIFLVFILKHFPESLYDFAVFMLENSSSREELLIMEENLFCPLKSVIQARSNDDSVECILSQLVLLCRNMIKLNLLEEVTFLFTEFIAEIRAMFVLRFDELWNAKSQLIFLIHVLGLHYSSLSAFQLFKTRRWMNTIFLLHPTVFCSSSEQVMLEKTFSEPTPAISKEKLIQEFNVSQFEEGISILKRNLPIEGISKWISLLMSERSSGFIPSLEEAPAFVLSWIRFQLTEFLIRNRLKSSFVNPSKTLEILFQLIPNKPQTPSKSDDVNLTSDYCFSILELFDNLEKSILSICRGSRQILCCVVQKKDGSSVLEFIESPKLKFTFKVTSICDTVISCHPQSSIDFFKNNYKVCDAFFKKCRIQFLKVFPLIVEPEIQSYLLEKELCLTELNMLSRLVKLYLKESMFSKLNGLVNMLRTSEKVSDDIILALEFANKIGRNLICKFDLKNAFKLLSNHCSKISEATLSENALEIYSHALLSIRSDDRGFNSFIGAQLLDKYQDNLESWNVQVTNNSKDLHHSPMQGFPNIDYSRNSLSFCDPYLDQRPFYFNSLESTSVAFEAVSRIWKEISNDSPLLDLKIAPELISIYHKKRTFALSFTQLYYNEVFSRTKKDFAFFRYFEYANFCIIKSHLHNLKQNRLNSDLLFKFKFQVLRTSLFGRSKWFEDLALELVEHHFHSAMHLLDSKVNCNPLIIAEVFSDLGSFPNIDLDYRIDLLERSILANHEDKRTHESLYAMYSKLLTGYFGPMSSRCVSASLIESPAFERCAHTSCLDSKEFLEVAQASASALLGNTCNASLHTNDLQFIFLKRFEDALCLIKSCFNCLRRFNLHFPSPLICLRIIHLLQAWTEDDIEFLDEFLTESEAGIEASWERVISHLFTYLNNSKNLVRQVSGRIISHAAQCCSPIPVLLLILNDEFSNHNNTLDSHLRTLRNTLTQNFPKESNSAHVFISQLIDLSKINGDNYISKLRTFQSKFSIWTKLVSYVLESSSDIGLSQHVCASKFIDEALKPLNSLLADDVLISRFFPKESSCKFKEILASLIDLVSEASEKMGENSRTPESPEVDFAKIRKLINYLLKSFYIAKFSLKDWYIPLSVEGIWIPGLPIETYICYVEDTVTVLKTQTQPKRLLFRTSDGNTVPYLLKSGEDLHLDQRILQMIDCLNFSGNHSSKLRTYEVIPLSSKTGLIQMITNCKDLYEICRSWMESNTGNKNWQPTEQFHRLRKANNFSKKELFLHCQSGSVPTDLIRYELWFSSPTIPDFLKKKQNFLNSLAFMSILGSVIGLGDRHLGNILVDFYSGDVVHIDYNVSFGKGKALPIPERVPCRLTRILSGVDIYGFNGSFKEYCIQSLKLIRSNREILMFFLRMFEFSPLLEWNPQVKDCDEHLERIIYQTLTLAISDPEISVLDSLFESLTNFAHDSKKLRDLKEHLLELETNLSDSLTKKLIAPKEKICIQESVSELKETLNSLQEKWIMKKFDRKFEDSNAFCDYLKGEYDGPELSENLTLKYLIEFCILGIKNVLNCAEKFVLAPVSIEESPLCQLYQFQAEVSSIEDGMNSTESEVILELLSIIDSFRDLVLKSSVPMYIHNRFVNEDDLSQEKHAIFNWCLAELNSFRLSRNAALNIVEILMPLATQQGIDSMKSELEIFNISKENVYELAVCIKDFIVCDCDATNFNELPRGIEWARRIFFNESDEYGSDKILYALLFDCNANFMSRISDQVPETLIAQILENTFFKQIVSHIKSKNDLLSNTDIVSLLMQYGSQKEIFFIYYFSWIIKGFPFQCDEVFVSMLDLSIQNLFNYLARALTARFIVEEITNVELQISANVFNCDIESMYIAVSEAIKSDYEQQKFTITQLGTQELKDQIFTSYEILQYAKSFPHIELSSVTLPLGYTTDTMQCMLKLRDPLSEEWKSEILSIFESMKGIIDCKNKIFTLICQSEDLTCSQVSEDDHGEQIEVIKSKIVSLEVSLSLQANRIETMESKRSFIKMSEMWKYLRSCIYYHYGKNIFEHNRISDLKTILDCLFEDVTSPESIPFEETRSKISLIDELRLLLQASGNRISLLNPEDLNDRVIELLQMVELSILGHYKFSTAELDATLSYMHESKNEIDAITNDEDEHVTALISDSTDIENLALMYEGWASWC